MKISSNIIGALLITAVGTGAFVMMAKRPVPASGNSALNFGIPGNVTTNDTAASTRNNNNEDTAPEETPKQITPSATTDTDTKDESTKTSSVVEATEEKNPQTESMPASTKPGSDVTGTSPHNKPVTKTEQIENTPEKAPLESHSNAIQQDEQTIKNQTTTTTNKETLPDNPETTSQASQEQQHTTPPQSANTDNMTHTNTVESSGSTATTSQEGIAPMQMPSATPPQQKSMPENSQPTHPVTGTTTPANAPMTQEDYRQKMIKALQQQLKALQDNPNMPIMAPNINNQPATPGNPTPQVNPQIEIPAATTQPSSSSQTPRTISIPMGKRATPGN